MKFVKISDTCYLNPENILVAEEYTKEKIKVTFVDGTIELYPIPLKTFVEESE